MPRKLLRTLRKNKNNSKKHRRISIKRSRVSRKRSRVSRKRSRVSRDFKSNGGALPPIEGTLRHRPTNFRTVSPSDCGQLKKDPKKCHLTDGCFWGPKRLSSRLPARFNNYTCLTEKRTPLHMPYKIKGLPPLKRDVQRRRYVKSRSDEFFPVLSTETQLTGVSERAISLSSGNNRDDTRTPESAYGMLRDAVILNPDAIPHKYIANYDQYMLEDYLLRENDIVEYADVDESIPLSNPNRIKWKLAYVVEVIGSDRTRIKITKGLNDVNVYNDKELDVSAVHRAPHRDYYEDISSLNIYDLVEVRNSIDEPWSKALFIPAKNSETGPQAIIPFDFIKGGTVAEKYHLHMTYWLDASTRHYVLPTDDSILESPESFNEIRRAYSDLNGDKIKYESFYINQLISDKTRELSSKRSRGQIEEEKFLELLRYYNDLL